MSVRVYDLAHSRTGDKGNRSTISVIAYDRQHFELIEKCLTSEKVLFSDHAKDSLACQALDHLGSGEALQSAAATMASLRPIDGLQWPLIEKNLQAPVLFFSARAPPLFL